MIMDTPLLELDRVGKLRPEVGWVLRGVNLTVNSGELLAVVGESGSGKTTLLRLIAGLEVCDEGAIEFGHRHRQTCGFVFQEHVLFPHLTVADNIGFGCHRLKRSERERRIDAMLQLIGMGDYRNRYPHQLSGGQQQRVALARSLAPAPEIILLDEPFSSLDANLRRGVREEVESILRQVGATAIFVTHDVADALAMADRVAVLDQGMVMQVGEPREVYERSTSEDVARLLGPVVPWQNGNELRWVRPEMLELCPRKEGLRCGTVECVRYCGTHLEVQIACDDRAMLLQSSPENSLAVGQEIGIRHVCPLFNTKLTNSQLASRD